MDSTVTVQELMDREFVGVSESDTVSDTASLMLTEECENVVVLRGDEPVGVLTQRDALEALVDGDDTAPVAEAMTTDVPTVSPATSIGEAASEMSSLGTRRLVVTEGDRTVGVLTEHDLISTSPFAMDATGVDDADAQAAVAGPTDERDGASPAAGGGFEEQSICEACGTFARDLARFNGQLLCNDCRDI